MALDSFSREEITKKIDLFIGRHPNLTEQSLGVELRLFAEFVEEQATDAILRQIWKVQAKWEQAGTDSLKSAAIAAGVIAESIKDKPPQKELVELVAAYDRAPLRWED